VPKHARPALKTARRLQAGQREKRMTHRVFRTVRLGLVVIAAAVLAACPEAGPGESGQPKPSWSPPSWLHGTWRSVGNELASATVKVSAYNVEIDLRASGATTTFNVAELEDDGIATITHDAGVSQRGERFYGVVVRYADGSSLAMMAFRTSSTTMDAYMTITDVNGNQTETGAIPMRKQT